MKLLLVEDDAATRLLLEELLQQQGYQVDSYESSEAAIATCMKTSYELAVLDWMLPGMDGIELCKWLRNQPWGEGLYIMMLTGRQEPADLERALEAGANDFLSKPVDPETLELRLQIAQRLLTIRQQLSAVSEQG
jgi:DNA-binding response OmpR family regulator